jgi:hypothetical protein
MRVRIPLMIQDPATARHKGMESLYENVFVEEDFFLDGPITKRVAVLDFCQKSGELLKGARFSPPKKGRVLGSYEVNGKDIYSPGFIQVNVFATVWKTINMFEKDEVLGRPIKWAFPAQQLLVVPRAGEMANAYYERDSHSIQFFFFPHPDNSQKTIYTSLSRDIVAHETGHAILDGIVPHLYDAITPQALALHESIADLTALLMAFTSNKLPLIVLPVTGGSIKKPNAFSSIADQFGNAFKRDGRPLRELNNKKTLNRKDEKNLVDRYKPHDLSKVLSGALYKVMVKIYEDLWKRNSGGKKSKEFKAAFPSLGTAAKQFKRMVFRALDYLPPGDISFADYGRAIIAADQAYFSGDKKTREWICEEFIKRHMVEGKKSLEVKTNFPNQALKDIDPQTLVESDWAAYEFANKNRDLLFMPSDVSFRVHPRLDVTRNLRVPPVEYRECIFKVSWVEKESNNLGLRYPDSRQVTVGTTLVIDWKSRKIISLLTSNREERKSEWEEQRDDRDKMLHRLSEKGLLQMGQKANGFDGKPLQSVIKAEVRNGFLQVHSAGRMLHMREEYDE